MFSLQRNTEYLMYSSEMKNKRSSICRIELIGTSVYGIRKYTRGAYLLSHLDHLKTHVVSAILNVAQVTTNSYYKVHAWCLPPLTPESSQDPHGLRHFECGSGNY